jgi:serine/threonine-protein phosphatase PGAM5
MRRPARSTMPRMMVVLLLALAPATATAAPSDSASAPAVRRLVLVRHGLYDPDSPGDERTAKGLIEVGREQARAVGERLGREGWRFDSLHTSPLTRARETADLVGAALGMTPRTVEDLAECTPATRSVEVMKGLEPGEAEACREQLERAVARFFVPARGAESRELLICHGNVIRYLVCRALDVDPVAWLGMRITNGGLSEIEVRPDGALRLVTFNDVGHLTLPQRTGTTPRPAPAPPATAPANK